MKKVKFPAPKMMGYLPLFIILMLAAFSNANAQTTLSSGTYTGKTYGGGLIIAAGAAVTLDSCTVLVNLTINQGATVTMNKMHITANFIIINNNCNVNINGNTTMSGNLYIMQGCNVTINPLGGQFYGSVSGAFSDIEVGMGSPGPGGNSGSNLILKNGHFRMSWASNIEVHIGSELKIDSAVVSPYYDCFYNIKVDGMGGAYGATQPLLYSVQSMAYANTKAAKYQGALCITNSELTGSVSQANAFSMVLVTGGGVVYAYKSTFTTNDYAFYFEQDGLPFNVSSITYCNFNLLPQSQFIPFCIELMGVDFINIQHNVFTGYGYKAGALRYGGIGIFSLYSSSFVYYNTFQDFLVGFDIQDMSSSPAPYLIRENAYVQNLIGIDLAGTSANVDIANNDFLISSYRNPAVNVEDCGIFYYSCPSFIANENNFYESDSNGGGVLYAHSNVLMSGIVDNNDGGKKPNLIEHNTFKSGGGTAAIYEWGGVSGPIGLKTYNIGHMNYGIYAQDSCSLLQIKCNKFYNSFDNDINAHNHKYADTPAITGLPNQGDPAHPAGNKFYGTPTANGYDFYLNGGIGAGGKQVGLNHENYYYGSGAYENPTLINATAVATGLASCPNDEIIYTGPGGGGSGGDSSSGGGAHDVAPYHVINDINTNNTALAALPASGSRDSAQQAEATYLNTQNSLLLPQVVTAYMYGKADTNLETVSLNADSALAYLAAFPGYQAKSMLEGIYLGRGNYTGAQSVLTAIEDSLTVNSGDSELITFVNYYTMMLYGQQNNWPAATLESDSTSMQTIAHSSGLVAGGAKVWLQYYFEDLPSMQSRARKFDTNSIAETHIINNTVHDSIVYTVSHHNLRTQIDTLFAGIWYQAGPYTATYDSVIYHDYDAVHYVVDTISVPVPHIYTDTATDSIKIYIAHVVTDTVTYPYMHEVEDTLIFSLDTIPGGIVINTTDTGIWFTLNSQTYYDIDPALTINTIGSICTIDYLTNAATDSFTYYTVMDSADSVYHFTTYYSTDSVTDSVYYDITYYIDDSLVSGAPFYNLYHFTDSNSVSVGYYTIGGVSYRVTNYLYNTTTDSIVYVNSHFITTYFTDSTAYSLDSLSYFPWVQLFPFTMGSDTDTVGGGGVGAVMPHLSSPVDSSLKINMSPNPFTNIVNVSYINVEDIEHDGVLRVINSLGQPVYSLQVELIPQSTGNFDIDLSKQSKGFYYIIIVDNKGIIYKNGLIKE